MLSPPTPLGGPLPQNQKSRKLTFLLIAPPISSSIISKCLKLFAFFRGHDNANMGVSKKVDYSKGSNKNGECPIPTGLPCLVVWRNQSHLCNMGPAVMKQKPDNTQKNISCYYQII